MVKTVHGHGVRKWQVLAKQVTYNVDCMTHHVLRLAE